MKKKSVDKTGVSFFNAIKEEKNIQDILVTILNMITFILLIICNWIYHLFFFYDADYYYKKYSVFLLVVFPFFQAIYAIATVINSGNNKEQILFVCCFFILALIIIEVLISINSYTRFNSINLTSACFHYFVCVSSIVEITI